MDIIFKFNRELTTEEKSVLESGGGIIITQNEQEEYSYSYDRMTHRGYYKTGRMKTEYDIKSIGCELKQLDKELYKIKITQNKCASIRIVGEPTIDDIFEKIKSCDGVAEILTSKEIEESIREQLENGNKEIDYIEEYRKKIESIIQNIDENYVVLIGSEDFTLVDMVDYYANSRNKEKIIELINSEEFGACVYGYLVNDLKNDYDIIQATILSGLRHKRGSYEIKRALENAPKEILENKDLMLEVIKKYTCLEYVGDKLKNDKEFVMSAIKCWGPQISCVSEIYGDDKDIIMEAVKQNGNLLEYASERLRNDKEVLMEAVKHWARLWCSSTKIRGTRVTRRQRDSYVCNRT